MSDIDTASLSPEHLELRALEVEYRLNDQKNSLMKLEIEEKRLSIRLKELQNTKNDMKASIKDVEAQLRDMKKAITE